MSFTICQLRMQAYEIYVAEEISQEAACARAGTGRNNLRRVLEIIRNDPSEELLLQLKAGEISLMQALADSRKNMDIPDRLSVQQIRTAMERFVGFDSVRAEFTDALLLRVPADELAEFERRLCASRAATWNLINAIRKTNEQRITE